MPVTGPRRLNRTHLSPGRQCLSRETTLVSDFGTEPDDIILERLQESASGDAAVRQLRRRYDLLRQDYERLIDRLGELEDRLNDAEAAPQTPAIQLPGLAEAIAAPLMRLRDEYLAAVSGIQNVVSGLEGLASGFKGQHTAAGTPSAPAPADSVGGEASAGEEPRPPRAHKVQVDVRGSGFGDLLDFQERLSSLGGVARVSINAIDNERATLVVELENTER
jgi:hypothetical protein